jgi:MoaA/NifB/PqqE/SkfB family radical SAM enzyme
MDRLKELKNEVKIVNSESQFEIFKDYFENPQETVRKVKCRSGGDAFHVNPLGKVYFCYELGDVGNVRELPIGQIWSSRRAQEMRTKIQTCKKNCDFLINCFYEED